MAGLNENQERIYRFICLYIQREGRPPTNREIGRAVGIASTGHVDYHLTVLERRGLIERQPKTSRGIRVIEGARPRGLPIAGTIAAGQPLEVNTADATDALDLSTQIAGYALVVKGDSMIEDHIADGDCVLVDPDATVNDGDIVVATHLVGADMGAATLKRLYRETGRVRLQPANATMQPIYIDSREWDAEWKVQGKVMGVYRRC